MHYVDAAPHNWLLNQRKEPWQGLTNDLVNSAACTDSSLLEGRNRSREVKDFVLGRYPALRSRLQT
jgi:hypothetical protein